MNKFKFVLFLMLTTMGGLWVINLPYPMIRRPVAQTVPLLLLPSFLGMDYNYRQAVSLVEQADQLVNRAISAEDFELGTEKVEKAQQHLDQLPVWFLGYEPKAYCSLFQCSWRFTYDEFATARASIGRMEAKIFQEKNALTAFQQGDQAVLAAKRQYEQAQTPDEQQAAIALWQDGMDQLQLVPGETVAGQSAQTKLVAYNRDFEQVVGTRQGSDQSTTLIESAKVFAMAAAEMGQNPPHPASQWEEAIRLWQRTIQQLEKIPADNPGYLEAQRLLATYESNLSNVRIRLKEEQESAQALNQAKDRLARLIELEARSPNPTRQASEIQAMINNLTQVQSGTTAYPEAQSLLESARRKLSELQG
ncbi:MAG: hypothetical protein VKK04_26495 [Synechococcales bacterium]|nr:hypothetical protein [Synechococcales bacterium]